MPKKKSTRGESSGSRELKEEKEPRRRLSARASSLVITQVARGLSGDSKTSGCARALCQTWWRTQTKERAWTLSCVRGYGEFMRLVFNYVPVGDLAAAWAFYRDVLGLEEAWRDGDETIAFHLPGSSVRLMVSTSGKPPGPMYLVPSVQEHLAAYPDLPVGLPVEEIPDGVVVGVLDPAGNMSYLFDRAKS